MKCDSDMGVLWIYERRGKRAISVWSQCRGRSDRGRAVYVLFRSYIHSIMKPAVYLFDG